MSNLLDSMRIILRLLKIEKTNSYLKDTLFSHPNYPSLLSISDTLGKYRINTLAVRIGEEKLQEIPLPCFVQVVDQGTTLLYILTKINLNEVVLIKESNLITKSSKMDFQKKWTGICLLVEKTKNSKEPDIEKKLARKKSITVLSSSITTVLVTLSILSMSQSWNMDKFLVSNLGYLILKVTGLITTILLLWYEVDKYNPALQSFCSSNKKMNCERVLGSKHAFLFNGTISVSVIAFGYFFSSIVLLLLKNFSNSSLNILCILTISALPVIAYSIYMQFLVIREWCKFCMILLTVLFFENVLVYLTGIEINNINIHDILIFILFFLTPILTWILLKTVFEKGRETNMLRRNLKKFRTNKKVFENLLYDSKKLSTNPDGLGIYMKNANPKYKVLKICNPYCSPCANAHPILEKLHDNGIIDLQILFTAKADQNDKKYKPVSHLLAINETDPKNISRALDDWYSAKRKDYNAFAKKYKINGELLQQNDKVRKMKDWCEAEQIIHTPTIFINGYKLSNEYSVGDLSVLLK
ncbi:hypothetical protein FGM00_19560 [Aggregatimonas sangjinii]|uniref:Peptidase C39 domain-containing protein n=1 Tax=Aggregatimonas sangjinii TaxID=2583587 RepID=A0A5B7SUF7_9FLAO|nr:vitamin K epoxide reductase family protein [Aggregatimonas sangjinii]QCX02206.1 hypothetical protein FGM00_19560 [Aggregatimonas sangjinii]